MVNIVTRSGFEFDREGEFKTGYGSLNQTNNQLSMGGHGTNLAYYVSLTGSRTDLGLEPPPPTSCTIRDPRWAGLQPCPITPALTTCCGPTYPCAETATRFPTPSQTRRRVCGTSTSSAIPLRTSPGFIR